jgi:hypothetical protein
MSTTPLSLGVKWHEREVVYSYNADFENLYIHTSTSPYILMA